LDESIQLQLRQHNFHVETDHKAEIVTVMMDSRRLFW